MGNTTSIPYILQGYDYGETNFENRNIVRQVNQYGVANDNSSTKQLGKDFWRHIRWSIYQYSTTLLALLFVIPSIKQVVGLHYTWRILGVYLPLCSVGRKNISIIHY